MRLYCVIFKHCEFHFVKVAVLLKKKERRTFFEGYKTIKV